MRWPCFFFFWGGGLFGVFSLEFSRTSNLEQVTSVETRELDSLTGSYHFIWLWVKT